MLPLTPINKVDVAAVVLPCAVMDSDASTVPGVQSALRALGVSETEADLSIRVYERADHQHSRLWKRAGHGVVHHGDGSAELIKATPGEVEWCVARSRELPADHLLFFLCRANSAMTLEVVRRIKERDPGCSLLVYGTEPSPGAALDDFGVPYHHFDKRVEAARWVAASIGRELAPEVGSQPAEGAGPAADSAESPRPEVVLPPWRPPEWEGTGAGMVPPLPGEDSPSALGRYLGSLQRMARAVPQITRSPLLAIGEIRRQAHEASDALLSLVLPREAEPPADGRVSGVPGAYEDPAPEPEPVVEPEPVAVVEPEPVAEPEPSEDPPTAEVCLPPSQALAVHPSSEPPPPGQIPLPETPWQNRPDAGRPMDVLLVTTPPWGFNNPPVALAHLATYARSRGYGVEVLDLNIDLYHRLGPEWQMLWHVENKNYWSNGTTFEVVKERVDEHLSAYAELIAEHPAPLVGFSVVDPKERCTIEMVRRIKQRCPEKRILLGGAACVTPQYRQIFIDHIPDLIDGYALGEGEGILVDAIEAVRAGDDLSGIPGVLVHREGEDLPFRWRKRLKPLDEVPFPLYEDFLVERYPGDELIVEWSRGCIGSCTFCKGKMIDGKFRMHSAAAIFKALKHYAEFLGLHRFTVCDPVINGDVETMMELCQMIIADGLEITWRGEAIPHKGLTAELAQAMAAAGCAELQLGIEAASDTVLGLMKKARMFSVAEAQQVLRDCHDAGIRTAMFVIIGFPGEGEQEFLETYDFVDRNHAYIDELKSINSLHIITDTPIHRKADKYQLVLPEVDYHYLWSTRDGSNTLEVRNDRIRRLAALAERHGIFVRETNLAEGKHYRLEEQLSQPGHSREELQGILQRQINAIESVNPGAPPT